MSTDFALNLKQAWISLQIKMKEKKKKRNFQPTARQRGQWDKDKFYQDKNMDNTEGRDRDQSRDRQL